MQGVPEELTGEQFLDDNKIPYQRLIKVTKSLKEVEIWKMSKLGF